MFYGADGQPWFRLDEQRHDVPLVEISPDLQHAVVAVEDRRFSLYLNRVACRLVPPETTAELARASVPARYRVLLLTDG